MFICPPLHNGAISVFDQFTKFRPENLKKLQCMRRFFWLTMIVKETRKGQMARQDCANDLICRALTSVNYYCKLEPTRAWVFVASTIGQ